MKKKLDMQRGKVGKRFPVSPTVVIILEAFLLTFILEVLSRRSLLSAAEFLIDRPTVFLYNAVMVALTLAFAMLFRKKLFSLMLVTVIWLAFGISNCVLLSFRTASPLTAVDLQLGMEAIQMIDVYFKIWQVVLIAIAIVGALTVLVLFAIKSPKYRKEGQNGILRFSGFIIAFLLSTLLIFQYPDIISRDLRPSLYDSYLRYGFPYCFSYSFFDIGITEPEGYSNEEILKIADDVDLPLDEVQEEVPETDPNFLEDIIESMRTGAYNTKPESYTVEAVDAIKNRLIEGNSVSAVEKPNIIFVQLESFFDPYIIKHLTFSEDPIPNFRRLKNEYTSGELYVPTVAGGTANTEFEVLTGCCLDFFGAGEFPYYSILKEKTCESLAVDLRAIDYTATAIHNYTGSFYYRDTVYDNLGFNRYISKEYMEGYELTPMGWPEDAILQGIIRDVMDSTEGKDFIYTVTVQTHGKYIELPEEMEAVITVEGAKDEHEKLTMEYFLTLLVDVDKLVGDLVKEYAEYDEDVMIVFFGDHLPGLDLTNEMLTTEDIYATEYVIWTNYELPKDDIDLEAYQLGAYALMQNGIDVGTMVRFHQTQMDKENYRENLEILEYDMLYGKKYVYEGLELKEDDRLIMGLHPITITDCEVKYGNLFIHGENFTSASVVFMNEDKMDDTIFVNPNLLIVPDLIPEDGTALVISQLSGEGFVLGTSEPYECMGLVPVDYSN